MDILSPVSPRNPAQQVFDQTKVSAEENKKENYIEGAEYIPLPSKGVFYTFDKNYWTLERLQVRQLNYTDEDVLTTKSYFEDGTIFNEILKNTIVDSNGFPATGLVPVDRDTILLWLRSTAFGKEFEIEYKCPNKDCKMPIPVIWDLSTFEIPTFAEEVFEELKQNGELKITTPISDLTVAITVPTIGKSHEAEKRLIQKKQARKETKDYFATGSLMLIISGIEVDGKMIRKKDEIESHFRKINLPLSDSRYIRREVEKLNLKYQTEKTIVCPYCGHTEEGVEMPMIHPNFFWSNTGI